MGSQVLDKAASRYAPMASATPADGSKGNNVIRYATSTAVSSQALNTVAMQDGVTIAPWAGKYVTVKNEDLANPLEFAFSVTAATLVYGTTTTFGVGSAACGWRIGPGETVDFIVPPTARFANWIQPSGATASTIALYVSEGEAAIR